MQEFFKGWRRKLGCVALVIALLPAIAWMRSYFVNDRLAFSRGEFRHAIGSDLGDVVWEHWLDRPPAGGLAWSSEWRNWDAPAHSRPSYYKAEPNSLLGQLQFESRSIPYWPVVIPLTVLAASLILWKERKLKLSPPADQNGTGNGH